MKKTQTSRKTLAAGIAQVLKRLHHPLDVMLLCVRWYVTAVREDVSPSQAAGGQELADGRNGARQLESPLVLHAVNAERETPITIREVKYLTNVIEQDHRAIKSITRPMLGFKNFRCAHVILSGIEVMHMIRKGQMKTENGTHPSADEQFYRWLCEQSLSYRVCSSRWPYRDRTVAHASIRRSANCTRREE